MAVISVPHDDDELNLAELQLSGKIPMESTIRAHVLRVKCRRARLLVARASKTMIKKKAGHIMKSSCGPTIEQPLYTQLECLRNLVPYSNKRENSCVIADAMAYLDQLTKQLDDLAKPTIQVNVEPSGDGLRIHLSCKKKPGLMATILALLEGLGLVFESINVSSGDVNLTLDALTTCSSTTVGRAQVSAGKIKMILLRTLLTRPRNDQRQLNINSPTAP